MRRSMRASLGLVLGMAALMVPGGVESRGDRKRELSREIVSGQVSDGQGPVEGARVRIQTEAESRLSDRQGRFQLAAPGPEARVTAWKAGYFIAGARPREGEVHLRLRHLPGKDNRDYAWVDPLPAPDDLQRCGHCHAAITEEWQASGHSRSVTGRHFLNLYAGTDWEGREKVGWGLLQQHPLGAGVCAACHAPTLASNDPAFSDLRKAAGVATRGVHCDYCHKIADVGNGTIGLTHGRYNFSLLRPDAGQLFFGPLDDVSRDEDAYLPLYQESRYCASCHEGVVFGVQVYSTYSEWQKSPARQQGKQCQSCHLRPSGQMTNLAPGHGGLKRRPETLANHRFFDPDLATMLRRCIRLSATLQERSVEVRIVAEDVGHRVPTGYIDRQVLVVIEASDEAGKALELRAGPRLPAACGPELKGQPGRLYARLLHDEQGHSPAPFWDAELEPADTRLRPGQTECIKLTFNQEVARVRVRVLYRRFWDEVACSKGWPDRDLVVKETTWQKERP